MSIPEWFRTEHERRAIDANVPHAAQILAELDNLEQEIAGGWMERQVQAYLKERPYLLSGRFRSGHGTYAFPELAFGDRYLADWLISSGNSAGLQWELIELECPQATPFMKNGHFGKATRSGIDQIHDWRDWIEHNLDSARRPRADQGIGLFDIHSKSPGLVVVGQNSKYKTQEGWPLYNKNRKTSDTEDHIKIESYETFIAGLRFRYTRPPHGREL